MFVLSLVQPSVSSAGLPFFSETITWEEEALLKDKQLLKVSRRITFGPDEWFRSGRGPISKQTISIQSGKNKILWQNDDKWPNYSTPIAVEFEDGEAIIVFPVYTWGPCDKYGYPQEGLIAYRYNGKKWNQVSVSSLSPSVKVNLLQGSILHYHPEYKNKLLAIADKQKLEKGYRSLKQGSSLADAISHYSNMGTNSCAHMRPVRDPLTENLQRSIAESERNAKAISSILTETTSKSEQVSKEEFADVMGYWTGHFYLSRRCNGIVTKANLTHRYDNNGGQHLTGSEVLLSNGTRLPFRTEGPGFFSKIDCDNDILYAFKQYQDNQATVYRFKKTGEIIDTAHLRFQSTVTIAEQGRTPYIWSINSAKDGLVVVLADYAYTQTANMGGIVRQKNTYLLKLND